jgi:hypothetical protein
LSQTISDFSKFEPGVFERVVDKIVVTFLKTPALSKIEFF